MTAGQQAFSYQSLMTEAAGVLFAMLACCLSTYAAAAGAAAAAAAAVAVLCF
jgi:hypothetical protein